MHKKTNMIGALLGKLLLKVSLFFDAINTNFLLVWLEKDLIAKLPKNSVLIIDNASFHKISKIGKMLAKQGHTLEYLPLYSHYLNPIELKWV